MIFAAINTLQDWRDLALIVFCVVAVVAFVLIIVFTVLVGLLSTGLLMRVRGVVKDSVAPAMTNVKETTSTVKGTVSYVSETAIKPVVKVYGTAAGAKRFATVVMRVARRGEKEGK